MENEFLIPFTVYQKDVCNTSFAADDSNKAHQQASNQIKSLKYFKL
jgi:hypothetical protein